MSQLNAFRSACGPRRVNDGREVIRRDAPCHSLQFGVSSAWTLVHQLLHANGFAAPDCIHHHNPFDAGLSLRRKHFLKLGCGRNENYLGARIAKDVSGLLSCQRGVDRDHGRSQQETGEVGSRPLRAVLAQNSNAISFGNSPTGQRPGHSGDTPVKLLGTDGKPRSGSPREHQLFLPAVHNPEKYLIQCPRLHSRIPFC